ncbi:hypothetical protein NQZ68_031450 [Dissostichus eleginoides]|nr:hypothetical protein NQZ68_031450 [Dissostichus eleginoides]
MLPEHWGPTGDSKGGRRSKRRDLRGTVTVPTVPTVVPPSPFPSLGESGGGRTADGVAGRGGADGGRARWGSWGGTGNARWDVPVPPGRGSWVDQMSDMSLSGRDSLTQDGGRNARVRRAVRISSIVAQEVRVQ